ncbi:MAG: hypothetical protein JO260_06085 [Acidobacteria bacterium]|nr:hypothetical protein [Acidobacteriota bacterium]
MNRRLTKYLAAAGAAVLAAMAAACGGGGGITPPPTPPSGPYSAASLSGTYAFLMSGQDSGGFFTRAGSFTANGSGAITGGVQDYNSGRVPGNATLAITGGSYTINTNGKGTLSLIDSAETIQVSVVLTSTTAGLFTETDGFATASGNFTAQDTSTFAGYPNNVSGPYVFDYSGVDPNGAGESIIGQMVANGGGGLTSGVVDINDDFAPLGEMSITGGTFVIDSTNGPSFGRGTATLSAAGTTFNFAVYIVGPNRLRLMRTNFPAASIGDAVSQIGTIPTTAAGLSNSFVFTLGGSSLSGADVRTGRATFSGGNLSNILMDDNNSSASGSGNSNPVPIPNGTLSATTYAVDPSGNGRGTMTFTDSKKGTYSFIFYLSSPAAGVIQDVSNGITSDGSFTAQSGGPYTLSAIGGNWALNWSGQSINSNTGILAEEDFVGQYSQDTSGNITGGADFTELSANEVITGAGITGSLSLTGDGTGRNGYSITIQSSPSATLNFSAYFVSPNQIYVVGTDTHRVITGVLQRNY